MFFKFSSSLKCCCFDLQVATESVQEVNIYLILLFNFLKCDAFLSVQATYVAKFSHTNLFQHQSVSHICFDFFPLSCLFLLSKKGAHKEITIVLCSVEEPSIATRVQFILIFFSSLSLFFHLQKVLPYASIYCSRGVHPCALPTWVLSMLKVRRCMMILTTFIFHELIGTNYFILFFSKVSKELKVHSQGVQRSKLPRFDSKEGT